MIPQDKLYHLIAGAAISLFTFLGGLLIGMTTAEHTLLTLALITPIIGGVAKELYDLKIKKTYFDIWDMVVTIAGGWVVTISIQVITDLLK